MHLPPDLDYSVACVPIANGTAGIAQTLDAMRQFVDMGKRDPSVMQAAHSIVYLQPEKSPDHELESLFAFVRDQVRYVGDVHGIETLRGADKTLVGRQGDCDDQVILLCSLFESIGYPTRFVVAGYSDSGVFDHVYCQVNDGARWIDCDPTEKELFGWAPPDPLAYSIEGETMSLYGKRPGARVSGLGGLRGLAGADPTVNQLTPEIQAILRPYWNTLPVYFAYKIGQEIPDSYGQGPDGGSLYFTAANAGNYAYDPGTDWSGPVRVGEFRSPPGTTLMYYREDATGNVTFLGDTDKGWSSEAIRIVSLMVPAFAAAIGATTAAATETTVATSTEATAATDILPGTISVETGYVPSLAEQITVESANLGAESTGAFTGAFTSEIPAMDYSVLYEAPTIDFSAPDTSAPVDYGDLSTAAPDVPSVDTSVSFPESEVIRPVDASVYTDTPNITVSSPMPTSLTDLMPNAGNLKDLNTLLGTAGTAYKVWQAATGGAPAKTGVTTALPGGGTITPNKNGTVTTISPGGQISVAPGPVGQPFKFPDGTIVTNNGDGTYTTVKPDGTVTTSRYPGSMSGSVLIIGGIAAALGLVLLMDGKGKHRG